MTETMPKVQFIGRFQDAFLKYEHGQRHFSRLVGLVDELHQDAWWRPEPVVGGPDGRVRIKLLRQPTIEWSLVLGDWIHNLRGCLDYATCGVIEASGAGANLTNIQFPFGRVGHRLNAKERQRVEGIQPHALESIEAIREKFSDDLHVLNLISNQDKHRLLLPVAVRQVPLRLIEDKINNTAAFEMDLAGGREVWTREIHDGDVIPMSNPGLMMGTGLVIKGEEMPFPLSDITRLNVSVYKSFMAMAYIKRQVPDSTASDIPEARPSE